MNAVAESPVEEIVLARDFHRMNQYGISQAMEQLVASCKHVTFEKMEVGGKYIFLHYSAGSQKVLYVTGFTPKRTQASAVIIDTPEKREQFKNLGKGDALEGPVTRIHASDYRDGKFVEMSDLLIALLGVSHRDIVADAIERKLGVPALVRIEYPELFIEIPERFAVNTTNRVASTAPERVRHTLKPFMRKAFTEAMCRACIERAHQDHAGLVTEAIRMRQLNHQSVESYDRFLADYREAADFYTWLLPHVSPGGVFYIPSEEEEEEEECGHSRNEDHLICAGCGKCRESLNADDLCHECRD